MTFPNGGKRDENHPNRRVDGTGSGPAMRRALLNGASAGVRQAIIEQARRRGELPSDDDDDEHDYR